MPKTKKIVLPKEVQSTITYLGMRSHTPSDVYHFYVVGNFERNVTFGKKLQKHHKIGSTYPVVIIDENTFRTGRDFAIEPVFKVPAKLIAESVQQDENSQRLLKMRSEQSKLRKIARDCADKIRPAYQRADRSSRIEMIRALVERLEEI